ncbi:MAG: hypothetical protein VW868_07790 [Bacteroidota bacterium]
MAYQFMGDSYKSSTSVLHAERAGALPASPTNLVLEKSRSSREEGNGAVFCLARPCSNII